MIEKIIILSLTTIGICATTWSGMIFEKPAEWVESKIGEFWSKPLFGCYICATFWYGTAMALILGWTWWYVITAMGLSAAISILEPSHD